MSSAKTGGPVALRTTTIAGLLPTAQTAYENTQHLLEDIGEQVSAGKVPDIGHIDRTVGGMVECVVRNPDAML